MDARPLEGGGLAAGPQRVPVLPVTGLLLLPDADLDLVQTLRHEQGTAAFAVGERLDRCQVTRRKAGVDLFEGVDDGRTQGLFQRCSSEVGLHWLLT
ncbi:hypothetical protein Kpho02_05380 [Kitasatospora phosalacinea]|uniref:Uncharacterized protein n=1 Tax=Kitasatospora phosalacinea TaxID=2065 RepID=A0A9W6UY93_9ACTN|nr:hypothetical protein [Kitasatospora phosalacinea]GLW68239.1 hypothetical protein Kpho02_05380 [Kitasatospora phosalacinea]